VEQRTVFRRPSRYASASKSEGGRAAMGFVSVVAGVSALRNLMLEHEKLMREQFTVQEHLEAPYLLNVFALHF